ncbi:hypothetical protein HS088_TW03G00057 [Tripterygium wilfordii]|uniref:Tetratricopeptide repeat (TPR)-like superfamily protein n=1 Tax=Tripterygium wilfordii TaxID=458696 RepID=A0A7J7DTN3_TRIWF|nr:uncharacterized protein LOC119993432 [Tripterygium wilfordii]KAF5749732.1 hypothetical protein HS088_TW03G00057 [Tripterygium wilfordii]
MAATDVILQAAILLFTLSILAAINYLPKRALTKLRPKTRTAVVSTRHFLQGSHYLARAQSASSVAQSKILAKNALIEAESAISASPRDSAPLILKAVALDLMGHKSSALRSLDQALSTPCVKSLTMQERADALVKRAELKVAVNRRRRVDSALEDLREAVRLAGSEGHARATCLMGQCYEWKGMRKEAKRSFEEALRIDPELIEARQGFDGLGL